MHTTVSSLRRALNTLLLAGSMLLLCQPWAQAQSYPNKPVRLIVPWPAGGLVDGAARQLGTRLQNSLGQPFVVENKLGAGGNIGADQVAKASADGYTLLFTTSALTIATAMRAPMNFDAVKDLERVALVASGPQVLVVHPASKINSLQDLIKIARANPAMLSYASAGLGSPAHLTGELLKSRLNLFVVHIPYTGAPAAIIDQMAGRIDYQFANAAVALPQVKAGKLRALAVTSAQRMPGLPQVPTMAEAGMKDFEVEQWLGLLAPKGTPVAVVDKLVGEINKVLMQEDFGLAMTNAGMHSAKPGKPEAFDTFFKQELVQWTKVVKAADIKPE